MPKVEHNEANSKIGTSLKEARRTAGFTLAELATRCDLSDSYLSKIERGVASATIANLLQICTALDIEIASLFGNLGNESSETGAEVHRKSDAEFSLIAATGYLWRRLGGGRPKDNMEVFHLVLPASEKMEAFVAHPGQEHCYVLSGEVIFDIGDQTHHLRSGDGIYLNSELPHRARSAGSIEANLLMTVATNKGSVTDFDWWRPARDHRIGTKDGGYDEQVYS